MHDPVSVKTRENLRLQSRAGNKRIRHAYYRGRSAHLDPEQSIRRSVDYFLEEFAVFACLNQQGLPVMVYPGSFSTLSEITSGMHPGAPREIRDLIVVSLRLKGRGSARSVRASSGTATP
uniref:Uncharacterized protein n=1 Tax=Candidatus Kentrum sp. LFY TaxID=2126342 RepID=A0A450V743_9GAMM|nr:MAG: hypothetical protein BECKLFY1418A_GA0070994_11204 [Candidatus Kentron sp. LFY]